MIKLQLLLRHPGQQVEIDPALRDRIEALGLRVTGCGRASISVEADPAVAEALLGALPPAQAGFGLLAAPALAVPASLADVVSAISIAPRHATTCPPSSSMQSPVQPSPTK